jgi:hypothetical protein
MLRVIVSDYRTIVRVPYPLLRLWIYAALLARQLHFVHGRVVIIGDGGGAAAMAAARRRWRRRWRRRGGEGGGDRGGGSHH